MKKIDYLIAKYNDEKNSAMRMYDIARRCFHDETNPEKKEIFKEEKKFYRARKVFCEEVLKDLEESRGMR